MAHNCDTTPVEFATNVSQPIIGTDGKAYVLAEVGTIAVHTQVISGECLVSSDSQSWESQLYVLNSTGLDAVYSLGTDFDNSFCPNQTMPGDVLPDGMGGILALTTLRSTCGPTEVGNSVRRIDSSGTIVTLPYPDGYKIKMTVSPGIAYLQPIGGGPVQARDIATWTTLWAAGTAGVPLLAIDGGGLVVYDSASDTISKLDETGAVVSSSPMLPAEPHAVAIQGEYTGLLWDSIQGFGKVSSVIGPRAICVQAMFTSESGGDAQGRFREASLCEEAPLIPVTEPGVSYERGSTVFFKFLPTQDLNCPAEECDWTAERMNQVKAAFDKWDIANQKSTLGTKFREATNNDGVNISLYIVKNPSGVTGSHVPTTHNLNFPPETLSSTMTFNVAPEKIDKPETFFKVALHEIGHALGVDENYKKDANGAIYESGMSGSSVMNALSRQQDVFGNIPWDVTICDREMALQAAMRLWQ